MQSNAGAFLPGVGPGQMPGAHIPQQDGFMFTEVQDFAKAVTSGNYETDVAALSGGEALRLQSLEGTLLTTIEDHDHFVLFNMLNKSNAGATVDEYTVKDRIGGFPGSGFNSELGDISEEEGTYQRKVLQIKYLMTQRQVSVVQRTQKTLVDTMADQNQDAILELLRSAEWGCFYGDSASSSVEFDGIFAQMQGDALTNNADHLYDMRGASLSAMAVEIVESAQFIAGFGNFGRLSDMFMSQAIQSDLDQILDPAFRVNLSGDPKQDIKIGTPVTGVRTSWGNIGSHADVFIQEGQAPFVARGGAFAANVTSAGLTAPTSVAGVAAADPASKFLTAHAGLYYYAVESGNASGRSGVEKSAQVTVAAGDRVTLTITPDAGDTTTTYFVIYRGRRNGTDDDADFREMIRVPRTGTGATPTIYLDDNQRIPGTSMVFLLTMKDKAIDIRRLMPVTKFPLYPTNKAVHPWAVLMFLALRMGKIVQHRVLYNVLPKNQVWQPF